MKFELYSQVAFAKDIPAHHLRKGDVATVVEQIPVSDAKRAAYVVEVFNAIGDSIDVLIVPETSLEPLRADEIWHIREVAVA
jgi:hypothetical protein